MTDHPVPLTIKHAARRDRSSTFLRAEECSSFAPQPPTPREGKPMSSPRRSCPHRSRQHRSRWMLALVATLSVFFLQALAGSSPAEAQRKKVVNIAAKEPDSLDPHTSI